MYCETPALGHVPTPAAGPQVYDPALYLKTPAIRDSEVERTSDPWAPLRATREMTCRSYTALRISTSADMSHGARKIKSRNVNHARSVAEMHYHYGSTNGTPRGKMPTFDGKEDWTASFPHSKQLPEERL